MPFKRNIYGKEHCPRCNAIAALRVHEREDDSPMVELRLDCPKCRLSKLEKVTTRRFLELTLREERLQYLLSRSQSPRRREEIIRRLQEVRKEKIVAEVKP